MGSYSSEIVPKIEAILANAKKLKNDDLSARLGLMTQVDRLYQDLESPIELFFRQWTDVTVYSCVNIAIKLGIFEKMKAKDSISAQELADLVGVDLDVIVRVMRVLVAAGIVASPVEETYSHTPKSLIFVRGKGTAVGSFELIALYAKSYLSLPEYLKTRPSADLYDVCKTPYAYEYGIEGKPFYEALSSVPQHLDIFNRAMDEPTTECGIFPWSSLKEEVQAEPDRAFIVDIGGGSGKVLHFAKAETGDVFGTSARLILQERPDALAQLDPAQQAGVEMMAYDFHTEQPIKGAHIYHLGHILHNHPDHICRDILKRIAEAMSPKSRLLIFDAVIPARTEPGKYMNGYLIDIVGLATGGCGMVKRVGRE
ncbi:LasM [Lasiodiplodia theobromae]|nr:LasM [Lasiodiplodia theobromae]